jgi:hypothetical protein
MNLVVVALLHFIFEFSLWHDLLFTWLPSSPRGDPQCQDEEVVAALNLCPGPRRNRALCGYLQLQFDL